MIFSNLLLFSKGIAKIPFLANFFPEWKIQRYQVWKRNYCDAVLGWGLRPTAQRARHYAKQHNLPYIAVEDGFLRSLDLGVKGAPPLSLVYDDLGIYYDTTVPSRLEALILQANFSVEMLKMAQQALNLIIEYQLSKYNHVVQTPLLTKNSKEIVLVIDQTFGDMAVKYGQADEHSFTIMLETAIAENPLAEIWLKTHPDVLSGKKQGYFSDISAYQNKIHLLAQDCNPLALLEQVDKVYCVTSQMGFEALMLGKPVVTFGLPWFAGWGLTDDRHPNSCVLVQSNRRIKRSLLELFTAAYLQYSRYLNPFSGEQGTIFDVIDYLHQVKQRNQQLAGDLYCVGMSLWKRAVIKPFFNLPSCRLHFISSARKLANIQLPENAKLLLWGNGKAELLAIAQQRNLSILRMEDGFIRSVGLGSNLVAPLSLVVDDLGIYFNAQQPSRLEYILQNQCFTEKDLTFAANLHQQLVSKHIGKYNVGEVNFRLPEINQIKILVVGQVEDDASIQYGSPRIQSNLALLQQVRKQNPEAYIVYKPHPDVVSGNRIGHITQAQMQQYADQVVTHANVLDCINEVDEVHTMTSLAGFEALLRGKKVYCYGLPFYANWGLTIDEMNLPRRQRQLTLNQLIAGTLIYYPLYINPNTKQFTHAEQAITILLKQKALLNNNAIHKTLFGKLLQFYRTLKKS